MKIKTIITSIITAGILLVAPVTSYANSTKELCESQQDLAHVVMRARQAGLPLKNILASVKQVKAGEEIVRMAYTLPKYSSEEYRADAADEFSNKIYLLCMSSLSK